MSCFAALQRATVLAVALNLFGGSAFADVTSPTPAKPSQQKAPALQTTKSKQATKPSQVTTINVTRAASALRAHRQAERTPLLDSDKAATIKILVSQYAQRHGVPDTLAHRIVIRESRYNPGAMSRAHFGLMQVSLPTARQMGYTGAPQGLLDARTNLTFGMPYLANAWIVSGGDEARALSLYSRGYYYDAKRKGLLKSLRQAQSASVDPHNSATVATAR